MHIFVRVVFKRELYQMYSILIYLIRVLLIFTSFVSNNGGFNLLTFI